MNGLMKLDTEHSGYIKVINPITLETITGLISADFDFRILANDTISSDSISIEEIDNGDYIWYHTPSELGSRKITISLELILNGVTEILEWPFSFSVVKNNLQDVYDAVQLIVPGLGSELVSILAKELISDLPVPEADYEIWDENNLIRLHSGTDPDANGQQDFLLNPGDYNIRLRKVFWNFPTLVPITVTPGGLTETIYGEKFSPIAPPAPNLCVIYGYTIGVNGEIITEAIVKTTLKNPEVFQDMSKIVDIDNETTSDINGYFELILIPNAQFSIPDSKYLLEIDKGDFHIEFDIIVPDTSSARFRDIIVFNDP